MHSRLTRRDAAGGGGCR